MTDVPRSRSGRIAVARHAALMALMLPAAVLPATNARAQAVMPIANPDADRLADVVRRLGAAPRDLSALIEAGDLSLQLGDATAAATLYKRAEAVDPNNGRVKAGMARILVTGERPGEALRFFDQAERLGAPMARYADDRGLAYDLIGEQERAQRDYRLALAQGGRDADALDEVRRRYALSLGISGRQDEALAQIDALLRRSDRGAWRTRAFILAMGGDVAGANKIAGSMMPRGMASGLAAFFQRLPTLSAADRAFAVHFGDVTPTPARLADARFVPHLAPLAGDAPRVALAANTAAPPPVVAERRVSRSEQRRRDRDAERAAQRANRAAASQMAQATTSAPAPTPAPASATPRVEQAPATRPVTTVATAPTAAPPAVIARPPVAIATATPAPPASVSSAPSTPVRVASVTPRVTVPVPARPVPPRISEDSILARIVAGISVPGAELGVAPMPGAQRVPVIAAPPAPGGAVASLDDAARTAERNAAADDQKRQRLVAAKRVAEKTPPTAVTDDMAKPGKARASAADADAPGRTTTLKGRKASAKRDAAVEDQKPPTDRKGRAAAAKAKKASAEADEAKKLARAEPARIWVQVAGGANADDLPKAWKGAQGKADALRGRRAFTTPNRATNRVVTGPFKTDAEARAMVNTLRKQGLSAFSFTSTAGQKMTRLDGK